MLLWRQYTAGHAVHLRKCRAIGPTGKMSSSIPTSIPKGWWADANYNTDTYDRIRIGTTLKAKSAISAGRLAVGDEEGCFQVTNSVPFDVTRPILYCASAVSAGAYGAWVSILLIPSATCVMPTPISPEPSGTTCYLVGILAGTTFTPVENYLTSTVPTEEDGLTYMAAGHAHRRIPDHTVSGAPALPLRGRRVQATVSSGL